ncbi:BCCT transporter [Coraliomargarita sinensis]|uniref:BCCT transporter n=1 Tax=Coraliomargarita sinensis TaxID=2174842 RepID=A0A317ZJV3_9BACT|nr:BCCT family transporter [Coraliomargarita sinensis]PXA04069.1 BCCT transporter [Coraliomargarita sinensis]
MEDEQKHSKQKKFSDLKPIEPVGLIPTDYKIGQDNIKTKFGKFRVDIHNPVFVVSGGLIVLFVLYALIFNSHAAEFFPQLRKAVTTNFDWFFIGGANIFVIFCLFLIVSPWAKIRLGGQHARPEFSYPGWFAMLFAAGMGIGLMFYGVSEPISHYSSSYAGVTVGEDGVRTDWAPLGAAEGDERGARQLGMASTIFHWGLHPWAIYAVLALALALFSYNKGLPLTIRSAFYPLFGEKVWGWVGDIIDTIAVFATLFGLATSLGLGAKQANSGLGEVFSMPYGPTWQAILIVGITLVALISVLRGLEGGVKRLSEINMLLAFGLLAFILVLGPTGFIFSNFFESLGAYVQHLPALSNPIGREDVNFSQGWTSFYWAWWISWSPFVGMFIARVSKGRTVREFIICVLLIPSLVCVFWMSTFGGAAISQFMAGNEAVANAELPIKLFTMLESFPLTAITSFLGIVLVIVFFVTSSDSGSLVIDTITAGGKVDAPAGQRIFWCTFEGLVAIVLLMGGGLVALQAMVVSTGLPFAVILLLLCVTITMGLRSEKAALREAKD